MGAEVLYMSRQMQQLPLIVNTGVYGRHSKVALRQRACLVEYHCIELGEDIQIVGALHQYSVT